LVLVDVTVSVGVAVWAQTVEGAKNAKVLIDNTKARRSPK
jgi:hypothetical protein